MTVNIERLDRGLTVKLEGIGSLTFFLQTLIRAKFYDDGGVDGLLSPLLNNAIKATLETIDPDHPNAAHYYSDWVAQWHLERVRNVISSSSEFLSASETERQELISTALYPHRPTA